MVKLLPGDIFDPNHCDYHFTYILLGSACNPSATCCYYNCCKYIVAGAKPWKSAHCLLVEMLFL